MRLIKKIMKWLQIVKVLLKYAKQIQKDLNREKSKHDKDSPGVLTGDEVAIVITECLIEGAVPELIRILQKK